MVKQLACIFFLVFTLVPLLGEDGYKVWLRYEQISNRSILKSYVKQIPNIYVENSTPILRTAGEELVHGVSGLLGKEVQLLNRIPKKGVVAGLVGGSINKESIPSGWIEKIKPEGFIIFQKKNIVYIAAIDDRGVLYGIFHFLRHIQQYKPLDGIEIFENPKIQLRVLNHWDNLDRTVERGYAGFSIFNWHELPEYIDPQYKDYARINASIGINGTVVTNVNANALVFRDDYMLKMAALADVFRPYGIKLYLTARFSSPIELGGLSTADPLDPKVQEWWTEKINQLYKAIPDFGGILVKANSEGQPGPQDYGRSHAEGANMLARALEPHHGIVMWRAFVYSEDVDEDRAKQAYSEFMPLDGKFLKNVLIQVKNGPIDFMPREAIHPLFGAMKETPLMMEFQITKEYLGQGTHLVGLSVMYEEVLKTDTYQKGKNSLVASVIDGSMYGHRLTGMAGVANIGTARNWTGNLFGQADWYAYGRLAWNPYLRSAEIYDEWIPMTFTHDPDAKERIKKMLLTSHETCIKYMTPLGLHHIMAAGHHYGPGPWVSEMSRPDWTSVYYHRADQQGVGFDRTPTGSNALAQYHEEFAKIYLDLNECPENFLVWYHHVPWSKKMKSGRTFWEELCHLYHEGVREVGQLKEQWSMVEEHIDEERFNHVLMHLDIQIKESVWWRDACLSYFKTFSGMEIPSQLEQPAHTLEYYMSLRYPYAPGIRPRW
ncbi:MAG TPA: alpha-glucuronidase family glycosyl hydrolase [Saprospiraceae bacterium]|nr:alpha-glucuronidase family glycosyl hydrolase [Saprospiraceae bacterium]